MDPIAVEHLIERYPVGTVREELLRHAAHAWSAADVDGAIGWVSAMKEDSERVIAATEIVSQIAQADPARAVETSDRFGIGRNDGTVEHIVQLWANENLRAALDWAEAQPASAQRDQVLARITSVQSQTAPADAARTALTQIAPGPVQDAAIASLIHQWSFQNSEAASAWVEGLPVGHIQDLARAAAAQSAQHRGVAAAQGWEN
jgi:hypothetical protein